VGALDVLSAGAALLRRASLAQAVLPGSKNMANGQAAACRGASAPNGSEVADAAAWHRQAKETKCGGMGGQASQRLNSTSAPGTPTYRHWPIAEQQRALNQKIRGHCAYYGITGNSQALSGFRLAVVRCWRTRLSRRNRERSMTWDAFTRLLERYPLPPALTVHSVYVGTAKG